MKVEIEVREELSRIITVEADSINEAIETVSDMYNSGEIILDADDFKGVDIEFYGHKKIERVR